MLISELVEYRPRDPKARSRRAKLYQMMRRHEQELLDRNAIVEEEYDQPRARFGRSHTYRLLGDFDRAMEDIEVGFALEQKMSKKNGKCMNWQSYFARALLFASMKKYDKALEDLDHILTNLFKTSRLVLFEKVPTHPPTHPPPGLFDLSDREMYLCD